jgi:flagellar hook-basal body complex protein FliE
MPDFTPYAGIANINNPIYAGGKLAGNVFAAEEAPETQGLSFANALSDAIFNIEQLQQVKDADSENLALGNMDDLTAMMINSERANASLTLLVELRNKLLEGYNEIMRTNV